MSKENDYRLSIFKRGPLFRRVAAVTSLASLLGTAQPVFGFKGEAVDDSTAALTAQPKDRVWDYASENGLSPASAVSFIREVGAYQPGMIDTYTEYLTSVGFTPEQIADMRQRFSSIDPKYGKLPLGHLKTEKDGVNPDRVFIRGTTFDRYGIDRATVTGWEGVAVLPGEEEETYALTDDAYMHLLDKVYYLQESFDRLFDKVDLIESRVIDNEIGVSDISRIVESQERKSWFGRHGKTAFLLKALGITALAIGGAKIYDELEGGEEGVVDIHVKEDGGRGVH